MSSSESPATDSVVRPSPDPGDFRNHLATADRDGVRRWLYPKKPSGRFHRYRSVVAFLLLGIMFAGPFIRINGNPLLMINIVSRRFSILGQVFWPADLILFAVGMLIFFTGILLFTTAFGRLWCGWACPQTVLMEMVFRKIEYFIEGDSHEARRRDLAPWTLSKAFRKLSKHVIFFVLSFLIGNLLLSYIIGIDSLFHIIREPAWDHVAGLSFMILFSLVFYAIFARFREQACTFICPYGRFQSVLLDENSLVVAYDNLRGEKRAPLRKNQTSEARLASGIGDCVGCNQCVAVCPTGIDIRNGIQMECVNCTACIDACDAVMDKIGRPRGLIRHASLHGIHTGERLRFTPRMVAYGGILAALTLLFGVLLFTRSDVETVLLRAPGGLFQELPDGSIANLYTVKVINKTSHDIPIHFRMLNSEGRIQVTGGESVLVPREKLVERSLLVSLPRAGKSNRQLALQIGIYTGDKLLLKVKSNFIGP